jgi:hypothetical protein
MLPFWAEATYLLETLVLKAAPLVKDGMDLSFTRADVKLRRKKNEAEFRAAMNSAQPVPQSHTNMDESLGHLLDEWLNIRRGRFTVAQEMMTVIVLTDGVWAGMRDDHDKLRRTIIDFMKQLKSSRLEKLGQRTVSIQFIQFGKDEAARARLRALDDDMVHDNVE